MVSQIRVVVTETAGHEVPLIVEKDVVQAGNTEDVEGFGIKNDFAPRNAGLLARAGIHPVAEGREDIRIEWRGVGIGAERIVDADGKRLVRDGRRSACGAVALQRSR